MSAPPRWRGRRFLAPLLGLYGGSTAVVGVLVGVGMGPGPAPPPSLATGTLGRQLVDAPVLPAGPELGRQLAQPRSSVGVPAANVGRGALAGTSFRPLTLLLPGGVTAPILSSGVHPDGSLVIPDNPSTVGWWNGGALAGDVYGSVVIAGHVDSARYGLGVMAQLKTLHPGQVVELRGGSHSQRYRIDTRRELPQAELAGRSDAFRQDIAPRLVLITCGGAFDPVRHRYQDNLILFADPVS